MNYKFILLCSLTILSIAGPAVLSASSTIPNPVSSAIPNPVINCAALFQSSKNQYLPVLAGITGYGSIISVALLIILVVLMVSGIAYAFGFAFHVDSLLNFAKTEFLESTANLVIIAAVGVLIAFAAGPLYFFANLASLQSGISGVPASGSSYTLYANLCGDIQNNIIVPGLSNWFGVFLNLYITNFFAVGAPPNGGLTIHMMPNGFGIAFSPFQGMSVVTALLWDEQLTYFGTVFMGMFIIVLLFMVYFLFPIFFYVGIALRSFPWTRPAGGSLIALFIAFYVIFPALMYPFLVGNSVNGAVNPNGGKGFCSNSQFSSQFGNMCNSGSLLTTTFTKYASLINFDFGDLYYAQVYGFINGIEQVGISMVGLIIALIISYELVEKIGGLLGSPSLQGSRALSRIL